MKFVRTADFHAAQESLSWIIDPYAVAGSTILLYGRQGIGKSSLAWQLAHACSTGAAWLSHPVLRSGPVCYLNLDMPRLEFRRMLDRGRDAGLLPSHAIWMPEVEVEAFDVLEHGQQLIEACAEVKPILLIVDTVSDSFVPGRIRDINAEVRAVLKRFHMACPGGVVLALLHDRKKPAYQATSDNEGDLDAFLGPTAWEAKATTSLRLTSSEHGVRLYVRKTRLDAAPYPYVPLQRTEHGFFAVAPNYQHTLMTWPDSLPADERFIPRSTNEVFRDVARRHNEDPETVKKWYQRAIRRGIAFPWTRDIGVGTPHVPTSDHVPDLSR